MRRPVFGLLRLTGALKVLPRLHRYRPRIRFVIGSVLMSVVALGLSTLIQPAPRIVWNASASAPLGLYWVARGRTISRGDLVLAKLPDAARSLAAERSYLPAGVPLVKRVAALVNDTVCSDRSTITINGRVVAQRLRADSHGRPLPGWEGCRSLHTGEVFLMMDGVPDSFDGRYFGTIDTAAIIGKLQSLWTW